MNYANILWGSVGTGVVFFSIYIAYIVIVKGRLRGMNITRELYSTVGAFVAFIVMMSLLTPFLSHLPSLAKPPPGGWVLEQYDITAAVLSAVKMIVALILLPAEEFGSYYSLSGVINSVIGFIGGLTYLTVMVIALYKALLALFPWAHSSLQ
jgi:hypothetical protein